MWVDYFRLAFRTFMSQKKRTALTLIGIFIGIAAVVALMSLGLGLKYEIDRQFSLMGTDKIFVQPGTQMGFTANTIKLTLEDVEAVRSIGEVDWVSPMVYKISQLEYGGEIKYSFVIGIDDEDASFGEVMESFGVEYEAGRGVEDDREVNIGFRYYTADFFEKSVQMGDKLEIEGKKFRVVGEVSEVGNPSDDSQVYISLAGAQDIFGLDKDELDYFFVKVKEGAESADVAENIKKELRKTRDVEEDEEDFIVQTTQEVIGSFGTILLVVTIVLAGIASISLLVGGVNIANTMYTAVMERTNEIGIMKAIGARNSDIFLIFLIESGILGAAGGICGIAAGVGMSKLVSFAAEAGGWSLIYGVFPYWLTVGAFVFSFIVGALAGTLPARQAAKMKPVDALRYE
ncbi:ABC transporter permease [Candidatus Woesearchaeota archaeon]|nr:ABC transporter permease [Candidatus Woesearchaeota archaeon]